MFVCGTCSKLERQCKCARFCTLSQSDHQVRLCEAGCYSCEECRDACDSRRDEWARSSYHSGEWVLIPGSSFSAFGEVVCLKSSAPWIRPERARSDSPGHRPGSGMPQMFKS